MKRSITYGILMLTVGAAITMPIVGCKPKKAAPTGTSSIPIQVAVAHKGDMASTIDVSGDVKALKTTILSAKISGRVESVPFREGDRVSAGAVVVYQDTSDLGDQARAAEAALLAAKSRLSQAETAAGLNDTQTEATITQSKAALDAAKAHLQLIKKGARTQEVSSAENTVAAAKANFDNAKVNMTRMRDLYSQGAISKQQMDLVQMQYDVAAAQYDTSKQQLSIVKSGAREEEIQGAQNQVEQAQEGYNMAKSNRAQKSMRQEDIKAARAGVAQAEAAVAYARQQITNARITTPIAGTVAQRLTEPGQMASPGTPVIQVVALDSVYFEATVSEKDIARIKGGQTVQVSVDAIPGRKFIGTVQKILPTADPKSRHFLARITVANQGGALRPGMFARGNIEVDRHNNTIIISKDALTSNGKDLTVYEVVGDVAKQRTVTTGFETRTEVEILSGVSDGDKVVVVGQDKLSDGVKVDVVN